MPPVLPPMPPTVHRHWAPDVAPYKYADDRDWDEYRPRQLPAEHHPKPAPKASRTTTKAPSNKRAPATDAVGPEPPKKRRKDESAPVPPVPMPTPTNSKRPDAHKPEERVPTDLSTLPVSSLVSYLVKHDIIPPIHPSPYTAQPALAPSILLNPPSHTPPPPPPPPSSSISLIPERERRRSSRFQEDDPNGSTAGDDPTTHHVPILPDLDAVHGALAKLVERHWHTKTVREQDTIAGFVWSAQRARERTLLAASSAGHG